MWQLKSSFFFFLKDYQRKTKSLHMKCIYKKSEGRAAEKRTHRLSGCNSDKSLYWQWVVSKNVTTEISFSFLKYQKRGKIDFFHMKSYYKKSLFSWVFHGKKSRLWCLVLSLIVTILCSIPKKVCSQTTLTDFCTFLTPPSPLVDSFT